MHKGIFVLWLILAMSIPKQKDIHQNSSSKNFKKKIYAEQHDPDVPIILSVHVDAPGSGTSGYVGCKVTLNGKNFKDVKAVTINRFPVAEFVVVSETTITFSSISHTGKIEVHTKSNGFATYDDPYVSLGYLTVKSGDWNQNSTWLNSKVPPNLPDTPITVGHEVNIATGLINVGKLVINKGASLTLSANLELFADCTNKGTFRNDGTLRLHQNSSFAGNSPIYSYSSTLQYDGYKGHVRDEWTGNSAKAGAGTPSRLVFSGNAEVEIASGDLSSESGLSIGDNCTFTAGSGDLSIGGDWTKSASGIFNPGSGKIIFRGTDTQRVIGETTFGNLRVNNPKGILIDGATKISNALEFGVGKILLKDADLTLLPPATMTGYNSRKFIVTSGHGKLWQHATKAGQFFPVGNAAYNPVTVSNATGNYGVRVSDSLPQGFQKEKMIGRAWMISTPKSGAANISVQYNPAETGKNFDAAEALIGYQNGIGWNTAEAVVSGSGPFLATAENLANAANVEQALFIGNQNEVKPVVGPAAEPPKPKETEMPPPVETPFSVTVGPNPFTGETSLTVTATGATIAAKVYSMVGDLIESQELRVDGTQSVAIGKDFPSGVYTLVLFTNDEVETIRIIKR